MPLSRSCSRAESTVSVPVVVPASFPVSSASAFEPEACWPFLRLSLSRSAFGCASSGDFSSRDAILLGSNCFFAASAFLPLPPVFSSSAPRVSSSLLPQRPSSLLRRELFSSPLLPLSWLPLRPFSLRPPQPAAWPLPPPFSLRLRRLGALPRPSFARGVGPGVGSGVGGCAAAGGGGGSCSFLAIGSGSDFEASGGGGGGSVGSGGCGSGGGSVFATCSSAGGGGGAAFAGFCVSFLLSSGVGLSFDLVSRCFASSLPCFRRRKSDGVMSSAEIAGVSGVNGGEERMLISAQPEEWACKRMDRTSPKGTVQHPPSINVATCERRAVSTVRHDRSTDDSLRCGQCFATNRL